LTCSDRSAPAASLIDPSANREKLNDKGAEFAHRRAPERQGMDRENGWNLIRKERAWALGGTGMGVVRIALLFGFVAAAFAMILVPIADKQSRAYSARSDFPAGVDNFKTGTIRRQESYTIRRSVLQPSPRSVCTIRSNGQRDGNC
jgi:hypothetical protein